MPTTPIAFCKRVCSVNWSTADVMGQAKQRGTFEQRIVQSQERQIIEAEQRRIKRAEAERIEQERMALRSASVERTEAELIDMGVRYSVDKFSVRLLGKTRREAEKISEELHRRLVAAEVPVSALTAQPPRARRSQLQTQVLLGSLLGLSRMR